MAKKSDYTGDRFGVWFVESRAKPVDSKRMWNCVNTETDEKAVVPQTQLKDLGEGKFFPSSESFLSALEPDVASSADITARVLIGNYKDDPFSIPDGVLPDSDEDALAVEFVDPFEMTQADWDQGFEDDEPDCCVADPNCVIEDGKHNLAHVPDGLPVAMSFKGDGYTPERGDRILHRTKDGKQQTLLVGNPWEPVTIADVERNMGYTFTKEYREAVAMLAEGYARLRDAISA
jgi:hypothetical protein